MGSGEVHVHETIPREAFRDASPADPDVDMEEPHYYDAREYAKTRTAWFE